MMDRYHLLGKHHFERRAPGIPSTRHSARPDTMRAHADMSDATPPRYDRRPQRACTSMPTDNAQPGETLRVEIDADTLLRLMRSGALCAAELRCLDRDSHAIVRGLCLQACLQPVCQREHRVPARRACESAPADPGNTSAPCHRDELGMRSCSDKLDRSLLSTR